MSRSNTAASTYLVLMIPALINFWILPAIIGFFMWSINALGSCCESARISAVSRAVSQRAIAQRQKLLTSHERIGHDLLDFWVTHGAVVDLLVGLPRALLLQFHHDVLEIRLKLSRVLSSATSTDGVLPSSPCPYRWPFEASQSPMSTPSSLAGSTPFGCKP